MKAKKNVSKGLYSVLRFWVVMFVFNSMLQLVRTAAGTNCIWHCFLIQYSNWYGLQLVRTETATIYTSSLMSLTCLLLSVNILEHRSLHMMNCVTSKDYLRASSTNDNRISAVRVWLCTVAAFFWGTFVAKLSYTTNVYGH